MPHFSSSGNTDFSEDLWLVLFGDSQSSHREECGGGWWVLSFLAISGVERGDSKKSARRKAEEMHSDGDAGQNMLAVRQMQIYLSLWLCLCQSAVHIPMAFPPSLPCSLMSLSPSVYNLKAENREETAGGFIFNLFRRAARGEGSASLGRPSGRAGSGRCRGSRVSAAHTCGSPGPGVSLRPATRAAPGEGAAHGAAGTLGSKPGPLHKLLIVMGGEGCCAAAPVWAVGLPASALCNAGDPCAVGFAVSSFHSYRRGVKNGIFQPGEVYRTQGVSQSSLSQEK